MTIASAAATQRRKNDFLFKRLTPLFSELLTDVLRAQAGELIRGRRVLDFMVQPGSASVKVYQEGKPAVRAEIRFPELSDEVWNRVFTFMAERAYYVSMLLSSQITEDFEEAFHAVGASLFPDSPDDLAFFENGQQAAAISPPLASVVLRFLEKIELDPFLAFIVRGRGREETLLELRQKRAALNPPAEASQLLSYQDVSYEPTEPLDSSLESYWSYGPRIDDLCYTIRADELPASLLKRLDPLPLCGLEDDIDWRLEAAYEKITRLAQGFGLRI